MDGDNISDRGDYNTKDRNMPIGQPQPGQIKGTPDTRQEGSPYSASSIQKSSAESLVLTLAAGLPVLQPPPKPQTKNRFEASSSIAGGSAGPGNAVVPTEAFTPPPQLIEQPDDISMSLNDNDSLDVLIEEARAILTILTNKIKGIDSLSQQEAALRQLNLLILSALAMKMLYFKFYGGMTGQEFADLVDKSTDSVAQPIKGLIDQFKVLLKENLPKEPSARQEIMTKLQGVIDRRDSIATIHRTISMILNRLQGDEMQAAPREVADDMVMQKPEMQMQNEKTQDSIINSMWQTYNRNLIEFSSRMRGDDITQWLQGVKLNDAKSPTEYYAIMLALSSTKDSQDTPHSNPLLASFAQSFDAWIIKPNTSLKREGTPAIAQAYPSSSFLAGCVICGADMLHDITRDTGIEFSLKSHDSPIADIIFALGPLSNLSMDQQAAAALIAALLSNGAAYQATDDTLNKSKDKKSLPNDLDFAINYAKNIIAIVTYKPAREEHLNPTETDQRRIVRLMLSVMALKLLYRAAYGSITGEEFAGLLKGETQDIIDKIKPLIGKLIELIKANFPTNEKTRANIILKLMDYMDAHDSIDSVLQSTRILSHLLPNKEMEQRRWEAQSG